MAYEKDSNVDAIYDKESESLKKIDKIEEMKEKIAERKKEIELEFNHSHQSVENLYDLQDDNMNELDIEFNKKTIDYLNNSNEESVNRNKEKDVYDISNAKIEKSKGDNLKIIDGPSNVVISKEEMEQNYKDTLKISENSTTKLISRNKKIIDSPSNVVISKEEMEQNFKDSLKISENSSTKLFSRNKNITKEKTIDVAQKTFTNEELMEKMMELTSQVESLKQQLSTGVEPKKVEVKKESKINFSKIGEFKDSKVKQAKEIIEAKKDEFMSKVDNKKQIVQAYAEMVTNNKYIAGAKATKAVFDKHIKDPVSEKATIKTLSGLEKVGEFQTKMGGKLKKLEEAIAIKTESIMAQNLVNPNDKNELYKTFYQAAVELGKEAVSTKFKESKLGKQISKISHSFNEKSKAIQETYKEKTNDVTLKQQNAKDKIKNLSTTM